MYSDHEIEEALRAAHGKMRVSAAKAAELYALLTDLNYHTEAAELEARQHGLHRIAAQLERIAHLRDQRGSLRGLSDDGIPLKEKRDQLIAQIEAHKDGEGRTGNPRQRSGAYVVERYIAPVTPSERLRGETPREKVLEATPATVDGYRVAYLSREGDNRYTRDNTPRFYALKPDGTPDPDCYASQQIRGWLVSKYEDTIRVGSRKAALAYLAYPR